jgi:adenylosuccinate lyase
MPDQIGRWVHLLFTSYDPVESGRALQYKRAFSNSIEPSIKKVIGLMGKLASQNADVLQLGRTHLQAALPITIGFWIASILYRIIYGYQEMKRSNELLVGKISGAVGCYNAQVGLGIEQKCGAIPYENRVLSKLGLKPSPISTQIIPPEPLAFFLHSCVITSAAFGQFGRDSRILMSTGIGEIAEDFSIHQSGSSTMAHKRNPVSFEGLEGDWFKARKEYGGVFDNLLSALQRDLVGSRLMRDFPIILIVLQTQLDTLIRGGGELKRSFVERIKIDKTAIESNFGKSQNTILSEPLYIALQMFGYNGDAHELVNHRIVPLAQKKVVDLMEAANEIALDDQNLCHALGNIPKDIIQLLCSPSQYTGNAAKKALLIADMAAEIANS